ncbi:MAG: hypothetical protein CSA95_08345 [Bacteroidetes bacterium]|nr:MAG: hypothetical protein CSA95_08345 [Bacteroidota bacterium]PIE88632.1 MAG: hypothetical protein CSA04_00905 [Bacteroidota bacterium]
MKQRTTIILAFLWCMCAPFLSKGNNDEEKTAHTTNIKGDLSLSLQNQHYWRGIKTGQGLSLELGGNLQITKSLQAGIWNGIALNSSYKEVDFYLSWNQKNLTITLLDYYCPRERIFSDEFTDVKSHTTPHLTDLQIAYNIPRTPFTLMASTLFWGCDLNAKGKNYYSTYLELGYTQSFDEMNTRILLGYSLWEGIYGSKRGIVNMEIAAEYPLIKREAFALLVNTHFIYNPLKKKLYFGAGVSLKKSNQGS